MNSSLRKVSLLIIGIVILPVVIFSLFEIGNMKSNEKAIQDIYKNQLDAILFSINQYSDDIISNLASRIENGPSNLTQEPESEMSRILNDLPSLKGLIQLDTDLKYVASVPVSYRDSLVTGNIISTFRENNKVIIQLRTYLQGGYRKIETVENTSSEMQWIVFLTRSAGKELINVLIIDPGKFISQVLDPKIQEIAKGKFDIAAFRKGIDVPVYISNKQSAARMISNRNPFWLLTNYQMGIELKNQTIEDLTKERIKRNLILIGLVDILLLLGAGMILRNVRKQVELSQLKSDFVSNVSHEIRTPLALITIYIETLEMGRIKDAAKVKEYYNIILNETTRLSGMVNRILSFSQIESNKRKYSFTRSSLNEIVENAANTFRYTLENKGFTYNYLPGDDLPAIMADKDSVTDTIMNLVDNAMKYSTDKKDLKITTGISGEYVFLEVEDHGIGISEKNQKLIFDKFYRVTDKNIANKVKGSGLGLAIVKHVMDAHNGKIIVKSSPGSGSSFKLLFPVT